MLVVNYNGNKPIADYYKYSVNGNNNADIVRFVVKKIQNGLDLTNGYHIYAKCDNGFGFVDKAEITISKENEEEIYVDWHLLRKHTENACLKVSISFENLDSEIVWQTQIFTLKINSGVVADEEIANKYPTILAELQAEIDELKKHQGGDGSSEVEIKRVYLTYDDRMSIRADYIGLYMKTPHGKLDNDKFLNDSTRIWYNFETTPINDQIEQEIKNGRFVIRLDYPLHNKSLTGKQANLINTRDRYSQPTRKYGSGTRGFTHTFNDNGMNQIKKDILLNSLIFINESDIKVNRYGEKYIHKRVSFFDYINSTCQFWKHISSSERLELQPITLDFVRNNEEGSDFFNNYCDGYLCLGVPSLNSRNCAWGGETKLLNGTTNKKFYLHRNTDGNGYSPEDCANNTMKLNPAFTCYTPLKINVWTDELVLESPYFISRTGYGFVGGEGNAKFILGDNGDPLTKQGTKRAYMSARPRCAILNDDYENADYAFLKTYPQADQQIRLYCKYIHDVNEMGVELSPVFRTLITQK